MVTGSTRSRGRRSGRAYRGADTGSCSASEAEQDAAPGRGRPPAGGVQPPLSPLLCKERGAPFGPPQFEASTPPSVDATPAATPVVKPAGEPESLPARNNAPAASVLGHSDLSSPRPTLRSAAQLRFRRHHADTPQQDFYAQSLFEQLSDLVDGIADFNGLHSVKSMREHRRRRCNTVDLSEWFASVYAAS